MGSFRTAARRIEKQIAQVAAGELDEMAAFNAIDRLEDRANKADIRGDDVARTEAWAIADGLRARTREARELGGSARQARWAAETRAIKDAQREERAAMDPALRAYQDELRRTR